MCPKGQGSNPAKEVWSSIICAIFINTGEALPDNKHSSSNKRPRRGNFKYDEPGMDRSQLRHLPPGKFINYLRLCRAEHPDTTISMKLFASVRGLYLTFSNHVSKVNLPAYPTTASSTSSGSEHRVTMESVLCVFVTAS